MATLFYNELDHANTILRQGRTQINTKHQPPTGNPKLIGRILVN